MAREGRGVRIARREWVCVCVLLTRSTEQSKASAGDSHPGGFLTQPRGPERQKHSQVILMGKQEKGGGGR